MGGLLVIISVLITTTLLCCQACSKVVHTHSTQQPMVHSTPTLSTHYLPPTDYTCRYQRNVFGTDCWKTLKFRKRSNGNTTYYRPGNFCGKLVLHCNVADLQGIFTVLLYSLVPTTVVAAIPTQYSSLGSKSLITSCVSF